MKRYAVVYEREGRSFGVYVPALPGCVAVGSSRDVVKRRIAQAISLHVTGLREAGQKLPSDDAYVGAVDVTIDAQGDVFARIAS